MGAHRADLPSLPGAAALGAVSSGVAVAGVDPPVMERSRLNIEKHFATAPSNPELASAAGMGVTSFGRAFLREFGTTPARYVTGVRVREAARLLLDS